MSVATNVDTSKCDTGCPGYPDDSCGSASKGVFAYTQMNEHSPSGTATVSSSTSTSTESSVSRSFPSKSSLPTPQLRQFSVLLCMRSNVGLFPHGSHLVLV
ncbi:unnamed protein product [Aspergillus oryzae]|nr:unnamed protein product [Aspergillus oryzae]